MSERIYESDLRLPALYLINLSDGKINTTELSDLLRATLKPSGEDLEILANRNDDYFSQIVRNLTASKRPFVKNGFISRNEKAGSPLFITDIGRQYLIDNKYELKYLLTNDFDYSDIKENLKRIEKGERKAQTFDENIVIFEGLRKVTEVSIYKRSRKLRDFAVDYFSVNGKISCKCCSFNFEDFYGAEIGKDFIEIHHTKPVFSYEDEDFEKTLEEAVKNLVPVCSNCHRMIHRNSKEMLDVQVLTDAVDTNGAFQKINKKPVA